MYNQSFVYFPLPLRGYTRRAFVSTNVLPVVVTWYVVIFGGSAGSNLDPSYAFDSHIHPPTTCEVTEPVSSHLPARPRSPPGHREPADVRRASFPARLKLSYDKHAVVVVAGTVIDVIRAERSNGGT